jgi:hypothetical protein
MNDVEVSAVGQLYTSNSAAWVFDSGACKARKHITILSIKLGLLRLFLHSQENNKITCGLLSCFPLEEGVPLTAITALAFMERQSTSVDTGQQISKNLADCLLQYDIPALLNPGTCSVISSPPLLGHKGRRVQSSNTLHSEDEFKGKLEKIVETELGFLINTKRRSSLYFSVVFYAKGLLCPIRFFNTPSK